MNIMHTAFFLFYFISVPQVWWDPCLWELLLCTQKMAGFLRTAPALQYTETMNSHPNDGLEAQWWETSLKTHRHWLLWYISPPPPPRIFKWCVSPANFFPWPPLKEHWNRLQWEKLDLFDHVTNMSCIQSMISAWARVTLTCGSASAHGTLQSFHLPYLLHAMSWAWCPFLAQLKIHTFYYYYFLKLILCFRFTFEWLISIDLRNDSNNSVTCIESYTVFQ